MTIITTYVGSGRYLHSLMVGIEVVVQTRTIYRKPPEWLLRRLN